MRKPTRRAGSPSSISSSATGRASRSTAFSSRSASRTCSPCPAEEIAAHAAAIRARLAELHARLEVDFPVYALFTKADLVSGFMEYFGGLDEKGRAQVCGTTFQTMDKTKSMLGEVPAEFDALGRAADAEASRNGSPRRRTRRAGCSCSAFRRRSRPCGTQLVVVPDGRSSIRREVRIDATLRGFYFTSGTQHGTPIDQLLGALTKGFGARGGRDPGLFRPRQELLPDRPRQEGRHRRGRMGLDEPRPAGSLALAALASLLVAAPLVVGAWWTSYAGTSERIDRSDEAAADYRDRRAAIGRVRHGDRPRSAARCCPRCTRCATSRAASPIPASAARRSTDSGSSQTARLNSAARDRL